MTTSALFNQRCKIFERIISNNSVTGLIDYEDQNVDASDKWLKCNYDALRYRSYLDRMPYVNRSVVKGAVYVDYAGSVKPNYVIKIDTNEDGTFDLQFKIVSVSLIYGFGGLLHHQELEIDDVDEVYTNA